MKWKKKKPKLIAPKEWEICFVIFPTKCQCGCNQVVWWENMIRKIVGLGSRPGVIHYNSIIPDHIEIYKKALEKL